MSKILSLLKRGAERGQRNAIRFVRRPCRSSVASLFPHILARPIEAPPRLFINLDVFALRLRHLSQEVVVVFHRGFNAAIILTFLAMPAGIRNMRVRIGGRFDAG